MNLVLSYLNQNYRELQLERFGAPGSFSVLMITPEIYRSNHVECLIMAERKLKPILVAKIPRTQEGHGLIHQEHENLSLLRSRQTDNSPQIPEVIAFEQYQEIPILLQTPIIGSAIGPRSNRQTLAANWRHFTLWQIELQQFQQIQRSATTVETARAGWFRRLIEYPIRYITRYFPITEREVWLLVRTWDLVQPLSTVPLPLVFEHKNLEKYNVKLVGPNRIGILEWDLADPYGLPACDLFRLLSTAAISIEGARSRAARLRAVEHAFFARDRWACRYVREYADALQLSNEMLTALFAVTWLRALMNYLLRLGHQPVSLDALAQVQGNECSPDIAEWLRKRPAYQLWEYTIEHAPNLYW